MSTKSTISYRDGSADEPHVHVCKDGLDLMRDAEPTVYVKFQGAVHVTYETLAAGQIAVTVGMPRKTAEAIGLVPVSTDSRADSAGGGTPATFR